MIRHSEIDSALLRSMIHSGKVLLAGNRKLKIYGTLGCCSGKRMKVSNRVFFRDEHEALEFGFRRCKKCMNRRNHERNAQKFLRATL